MGQRINKYTRGDYDAIVYIDGTEVIAEDSLGRKIASGVAGTDDTTVIQAALDIGGTIRICDGTYSIDADFDATVYAHGLVVKDNTTLLLDANAVLQAQLNADGKYTVVLLSEVDNITIRGGSIIGERAIHTEVVEENGMCVRILASTNVTIDGVNISDGWGDGIYIGKVYGTASEDITIQNCNIFNNRRNNISIVACDVGKISGCVVSTANGHAPQNGIDIEPNAGDTVTDFQIIGNNFVENATAGVRLVGFSGEVVNVIVSENTFNANNTDENADYGDMCCYSSVNETACTISGNKYINASGDAILINDFSNVLISGEHISYPGQSGIRIKGTSKNINVNGNTIHAAGRKANDTYDAISIEGTSSYINLSDNVVTIPDAGNYHRWGLYVSTTGDGIKSMLDTYTGNSGNVYVSTTSTVQFDFPEERSNIIGTEWDTSAESPILTQIDRYGNAISKKPSTWFNEHPIFGGMWRCTLSDDGVPTFGTNPRGDGLTLDGSTGNVMVRIPKFYVRSAKTGTKIQIWISDKLESGYELHPLFYQRNGIEKDEIFVGAYMSCLDITDVTGVRRLKSKSGEQPITGGEILEIDFDSGSVAPVVGEIATGTTSSMQGTVVDVYVTAGAWGTGDAEGKVYLKNVSDRLYFNNGSHEPIVGEIVTGNTSGATGKVSAVVVTGGAWGTNDAVGHILIEGGSGNRRAYTIAENILDPDTNVIGVATSTGSELGQFTNPETIDGSTGGADIFTCKSVGSALSLTLPLIEEYANNIGFGWGALNVWTWGAIQLLWRIEYCNLNSQTEIGAGVVSVNAGRRFMGADSGADSSNTNIGENGTGTGTGSNGFTPVVYRGIENPWGNAYIPVIGADATDAEYRIINPFGNGKTTCPLESGSYVSSTATPVTYPATSDGYAKNILYEDLTKFLLIPSEQNGSGSENAVKYLCDYARWHRNTAVNILIVGGHFYSGVAFGINYFDFGSTLTLSARYMASRIEFMKSSRRAKGTSTGTGAEQTIAHGLAAAPSIVVVEIPSIGYKGSCTADDTNIYPVVYNGVVFNWYAEV